MSDSPPMFEESKELAGDDMFFSTIGELNSKKSNDASEMVEDMDEIFNMNSPKPKEISASLDATNEIKLDDDEDDDPFSFKTDAPKKVEQPLFVPQAATSPSTNLNLNPAPLLENNTRAVRKTETLDVDDENEEDRDKFLEVKLSDPLKIGDGMSSYMTYKLQTKTNYPVFKQQQFEVNRRFSDFLALYEKLKVKHVPNGLLLPAAPEKDAIGTAKLKITKDDTSQPNDFLEKRKISLERFLNRLAKHKTFKLDPDFRDFLTNQDAIKSMNTSAISKINMLNMLKMVNETVNKITTKMDEKDQWFDEKAHECDNLYAQFKRLHASVETIYGMRKELASSTKDFAKSISILANIEEHVNLSKALAQLGEIHEKIDQLQLEQANSDFFIFAELIRDYIGLFESVKEAFNQRITRYQNWQKAEDTLRIKRDNKVKLETANKKDKLPTAEAEINEWEGKSKKSKEEFELISKTIKQEVKKFDTIRVQEFKEKITQYLNNLLNYQTTLCRVWEQYLPDVKAI